MISILIPVKQQVCINSARSLDPRAAGRSLKHCENEHVSPLAVGPKVADTSAREAKLKLGPPQEGGIIQ